jgi:hypothetical protein
MAASRKGRKGGSRRPLTYDAALRIALALPGSEEGTSYGTPAVRVGGKFLFRLREDGDTLALRIGFAERDMLIENDPHAFYLTDHYRDYPAVLVRLSAVRLDVLRAVIEQAWGQVAPRRLGAASAGSASGRRAIASARRKR